MVEKCETGTINHNRKLLIILALALFVRLGAGVLVDFQVRARNRTLSTSGELLFPDSINMRATAVNLAEGKGYVDEHGRRAWRMPAYQVFLAGLHKIGLGSPRAIRIAQAFLDVFNCLLIFHITRRRKGGDAGLFAAGMLALYPFLVYFSALVLTETITVTAVLLSVLTLDRLLEKGAGNARNAILCGLALGLAVLVKASFALLAVFYVAWIIICNRDKIRPALKASALLLFACALALAPWVIRNYSVFGEFVPFSTMGGYTLYESNSPNSDGGPNNGKIVFPAGSDTLPELARDHALKQASIAWIKENPGQFLRLGLEKFSRTWWPVPNYSAARRWQFMLATLCSYVPVMLFGAYGLWLGRKNWRRNWAVILPVLYVALLHSVFLGSIRYRLSVMPCMMIPAAEAVLYVWGLIERKYSGMETAGAQSEP